MQTDIFFGNVAPTYNNIVSALIILLLGIVIGRLIGILLDRLFKELQIDKAAQLLTPQTYSLSKTISDLVSFSTYIIVFFLALKELSATNTVLEILFILFILVIGGSIILNSIYFFPNLYAGFKLRKHKLYNESKFNVMNISGTLIKIGLLNIKIKSDSKEEIYIPNYALLKEIKKLKLI